MRSTLRSATRASQRWLPAYLLAAGVVLSASAKNTGPAAKQQYQNLDYGYAVTFPIGLTYETNKAPNPNHGFRINVSSGISVWVDSSYTDGPTLKEAVTSERAMWEENCSALSTEASRLDGVRATQVTLKCSGEPAGGGPTIVTLLIALGKPLGRSLIRYEIGMQYPSGDASKARAEEAFNAVRDGFRFLRRVEHGPHAVVQKSGG